MKLTKLTTLKYFGILGLTLAMAPAFSMAQNRPQVGAAGAGGGNGGGGMGYGGGGQLQQIQQVIRQLDLPTDEQGKIQDIMKKAATDAREARQGMQNAAPDERQEKMQAMQKITSDAKDGVIGILTDDQKARFFPLLAKADVTRGQNMLKATQTAAGKMEIKDDEKAQLKSLFDDTQKTIDGYTTQAAAVTDAKGETDLQEKVTGTQRDTVKQLASILGTDDTKQLMQEAMKQMAQEAMNGRGRGGTPGGATTKPADK